jgi:hypothetical protein
MKVSDCTGSTKVVEEHYDALAPIQELTRSRAVYLPCLRM